MDDGFMASSSISTPSERIAPSQVQHAHEAAKACVQLVGMARLKAPSIFEEYKGDVRRLEAELFYVFAETQRRYHELLRHLSNEVRAEFRRATAALGAVSYSWGSSASHVEAAVSYADHFLHKVLILSSLDVPGWLYMDDMSSGQIHVATDSKEGAREMLDLIDHEQTDAAIVRYYGKMVAQIKAFNKREATKEGLLLVELDSEYHRSREIDSNGPIQHSMTSKPDPSRYAHSDDFRSITWKGETASFTPKTAGVMQVLWEAADKGLPDVTINSIMERAGMSEGSDIRRLFKSANLRFQQYIVRGTRKDTYRLNFD